MMRRTFLCFCFVILVGSWLPVEALNPGADILVPAAARAGSWVTDLYIMNPNDESVSGSVFWLERGQANNNPISIVFALDPGETMVMPDVLMADFGFDEASGAFRVTADGDVIVNSRIYSADGDRTFGQGFEGVPIGAAATEGMTADIVGLSNVNQVYRTNFYALAGADGASMSLVLVDPDGSELAAGSLDLAPFEPYLKRINQVIPSGNFAEGTLRVTVSSGLAVVGASKVDELSTDPTTLESSTPLAVKASVDGTYEFTLTDSDGYAAGGKIVVAGGVVETISGTFANWDKDDDSNGQADCPLVFQWGLGFPMTSIEDMADGVTFSDSYSATGSGEMAWTVHLTAGEGFNLSGSVSAAGSEFPSSSDPTVDESGCNGTFPVLTLAGGKVN